MLEVTRAQNQSKEATLPVSSAEFLKQFMIEIRQCDPMERQTFINGWARHLDAREKAQYSQGYAQGLSDAQGGKE